jgi:hypothetical protein
MGMFGDRDRASEANVEEVARIHKLGLGDRGGKTVSPAAETRWPNAPVRQNRS